ncbi:uncharacterized protein LOC144859830 [Branchiostoma floridae x Branchiostoma japonicum]
MAIMRVNVLLVILSIVEHLACANDILLIPEGNTTVELSVTAQPKVVRWNSSMEDVVFVCETTVSRSNSVRTLYVDWSPPDSLQRSDYGDRWEETNSSNWQGQLLVKTSTLMLRNAVPEDAGTYNCSVTYQPSIDSSYHVWTTTQLEIEENQISGTVSVTALTTAVTVSVAMVILAFLAVIYFKNKTEMQLVPTNSVKPGKSDTHKKHKRRSHGVHETPYSRPSFVVCAVLPTAGTRTIRPSVHESIAIEHSRDKEDTRGKAEVAVVHEADETDKTEILKMRDSTKVVRCVHYDMNERQCSENLHLSKTVDDIYGSKGSNASSGYGSMVPSPRPSPDIRRSDKDTKAGMPHDMTADEDRQRDLQLFNKLCSDYSKLHVSGKNFPLSDRLQTNYSSTNFAAGAFDHTGGHLSLPRHDINLFIPPGAIEEGPPQTIHIFVPPSMNRGKPAPVVHCGPTGTTFLDHVILSFPVDPDHDKIVPRFTNTDVGEAEEWKPLLQDDDAASIVGNNKCTLFLSHFTGYGAEGKTKTSPSNMSPRSSHSPTEAFLHQQEELRPSNCAFPILSSEIRRKMCVLLDVEHPQGKDWRMMAEKLGIDPPTGRWIDSRFKSPTSKLLDFWETQNFNYSGGIVALWRLAKLCEEIGRPDVAELVQNTPSPGRLSADDDGQRGLMSTLNPISPNSSFASLNHSVFSEPCPENRNSDSVSYGSLDTLIDRAVLGTAPKRRDEVQSPDTLMDSGYGCGDLMSTSSQITPMGSQSTLELSKGLFLPEPISPKRLVWGPIKGMPVTDI